MGQQSITHIGGRNPLGEVWSLKLVQAIAGIQSRELDFFVNHKGNSFPIQMVDSEDGPMLSSMEKGKNLLFDLPDCPE